MVLEMKTHIIKSTNKEVCDKLNKLHIVPIVEINKENMTSLKRIVGNINRRGKVLSYDINDNTIEVKKHTYPNFKLYYRP